jgi:hypothetical protein
MYIYDTSWLPSLKIGTLCWLLTFPETSSFYNFETHTHSSVKAFEFSILNFAVIKIMENIGYKSMKHYVFPNVHVYICILKRN